MLVGESLQQDLHIVFTFQPEFQDIELQHADDPADDLLHTGVVLLEDLDGAFLGDLGDTLDKLVPLHGVHLADTREVLRRECRDPLITESLFRHAEGVADRIEAGVKHTDDVSGIGLLQDLSVAGHQLLGLGKALDPAGLYMLNIHPDLIAAGADAHEGNAVTVGFVHICLDLENKGGKALLHGIHRPLVRIAGRGRERHLQEILQKDLHAEIVQGGSEKDRRQKTGTHSVEVKLRACTV